MATRSLRTALIILVLTCPGLSFSQNTTVRKAPTSGTQPQQQVKTKSPGLKSSIRPDALDGIKGQNLFKVLRAWAVRKGLSDEEVCDAARQMLRGLFEEMGVVGDFLGVDVETAPCDTIEGLLALLTTQRLEKPACNYWTRGDGQEMKCCAGKKDCFEMEAPHLADW